MIGPFLLILNQYFNILVNEYYVLWVALVSYAICRLSNLHLMTILLSN